MASSVDELKALANTKLGFARPNRFLVTFPTSFGGSGGILGSVLGLLNIGGGGASGRELNILCSNTTLPAKVTLTSERRIGMEFQKVAYGYAVDDVSMTFYLMNDYGVKEYFDAWRNSAIPEDGGNAFTSNYKSSYAKSITIHQLRQPLKGFSRQVGPVRFGLGLGGGSVYSVELLEAFPVATSAIELNNELDGLVQLTVTFAYTNWRRASNTQGFINMDIDTPLGGIDVL
mgnify:FL=1|jgi:hypothetical protein|tara:strand:- start:254 stop:946 length:693 start_codon:yes stop_codon:yes gene_type:complete